MKAILLAGGAGTRLHPITKAVSKQLVPVYDKPMIFYPISTLMLAGVREILIITTPIDQPGFERLLGDGTELGLSLQYATQAEPEGIAQAFLIARDAGFLGAERVVLALGDNIFYGSGLREILRRAANRKSGSTIFGYRVKDPERYGVVTFDSQGKAVDLQEKPERPRTPYAIPGLYFYDDRALEIASSLVPSARGELEITDVNRAYLEAGTLHVEILRRGIAWLDTGTHEALLQASNFIQAIEERQGIKVACLEEIAFRMGFIDADQVRSIADTLDSSDYGRYLRSVVDEFGADIP